MIDKADKGHYFGPDGYLAEVEEKHARGEIDESGLSSAYYSAATHARASGDEDIFKIYLQKAIEVSDALAARKGERMTASELDVRQSILRKAGRLDEALAVIERGLLEADTTHTKALLLLGKVDVLMQRKDTVGAENLITEVEKLVSEVEEENKLQAIRVYRGIARFYKAVGDEDKSKAMAEVSERLIDETGAEDQHIKLKKDLI